MANIHVSAALSRNPLTQPILDGSSRTQGIEINAMSLHPSELFWRQLKFREFDISEMSLASLMILHASGDRSWAALPVFTSRRFFHTGVLVRADSNIAKPADLKGKFVGIPEYQQTAAVWSRGVLEDDFGVSPSDIHWVMERQPDRSHSGVTGFTPPDGVQLTYGPTDVTTAQMLAAGDLDALLIHLPESNLVDRGAGGQSLSKVARPLFADRHAESARYFNEAGFVPANHCVVIRRELVDEQPWLPLSVYGLFVDVKADVDKARRRSIDRWRELGLVSRDTAHRMRGDHEPYGLVDLSMLEALARYAHAQGLTEYLIDPRDLFEPQFVHLDGGGDVGDIPRL